VARKRAKIFNELKEALEDVREYRLGKRTELCVTELPAPPKRIAPAEIRRIRRADRAETLRILGRSGKGKPPMEGDELPPDLAPDGKRSGETGKSAEKRTPQFSKYKKRLEKTRDR
jgi:hypothetical protein